MVWQPRPYQVYCVQRVLDTPKLALWLDMGLGKSAITLTAFSELKYNRLAARKCLVIAPKTVAEATWTLEAEKWDHLRHLRIQIVMGAARQRVRALHTPADVYVINRENVVWLVDQLGHNWDFDFVVLDESSSFKSHTARRFRALRNISPRIARMVQLTGTPAGNSLMDLWAQVYLLDGGQRLGPTITGYRERYFNPDKRGPMQIYTWKAKGDTEDTVKALLGDICVCLKASDYLTMPPMIPNVVPVKLDKHAREQYTQLERQLVLELPEGVVDVGTAAALSNKLLQLCNGAIYRGLDAERETIAVHNCKLDAFDELLERLNGEPCLVFYAFQHDRDRLLARLSKHKSLRVRVYRGKDDAAAWNAGELDVLLAHPASTAYGLNLQNGGRHVIWFGMTWSLEQYQQANARLHRQGQTKPVIVHHLVVQDGLDIDVMAALEGKRDTQEALLQALKARIDAVGAG